MNNSENTDYPMNKESQYATHENHLHAGACGG